MAGQGNPRRISVKLGAALNQDEARARTEGLCVRDTEQVEVTSLGHCRGE